ncbi:hypothetical protein I6M39_07610 [Shewanella algae]|uniref:hypothetical protein n=1 Tax=Shewanella algae TaxID=38313 RepID=UPI001AAD8D87|nr:hypothetical protein [Shewanella algae]MBO2568870.1 hypothetical protein [Shewanella algae]
MKMTHHAATRAAQRALEQSVLELSLQFGENISTPDGQHFLSLTLKMRKQLARKLRQILQQLEKPAGQFVLATDDETIITCGHRTKRLWKKL